MKKHANIPIFIPHLGCPNMCVFCNQRSISGHGEFDRSMVDAEITRALSTITSGIDTEIAFFGGSFTGIDRELMTDLLKTAYKYVSSGQVSSIRLSTRPDYISREILEILKQYGVRTIELGIQSMSDRVLVASRRGHTSQCTKDACKMITEYSFDLVGQMMIGLPESDADTELECARFICKSGAVAARVYPTVVFHGTELSQMSEKGGYHPLTLEEAVMRTKNVLAVFADAGVPCIRVGLCAGENLSSPNAVYAGPNHSAVGELAMSELFFDKIAERLDSVKTGISGCALTIIAPRGCTSKVSGHKGINKKRIVDKYNIKKINIVENDAFLGYNIQIELQRTGGCGICI